ncbi:MAG TPA: ParB/RepB/Spo0J family partition protein [Amycolatopsis sp.]|uniref:ParB/RepB/Spo0J family partition protein n=1 Tax=Amycolatopsis nalaikhensis TaxID=715472 RepID=A0ABY8XZ79_9PSEU|nr:ParB/RepB/Spo0J family partition protein [Amycolatopsis sp. 2-2]WIV61039.1 ParB/RepB/Spo0J family partition protein [Amycolatopsis sp. 2-2]
MKGQVAERTGLSAVPEKVPIARLVAADSPRLHGEHADHVKALAAMDTPLPPIVVHRSTMKVIDGMHRLRAAVLRGEEALDVLFFTGADADAFVLAVELNHAHGLPLSTADRKVAAARIVDSHPTWSDRRISAVTGLAASTVATVRRCSSERIRQSNVRVGKDGRVRPVDGTEARMRAAELMTANPSASLREVAKAVRISPSTAKDVRARLSRGESPVTPRQRKRDDAPPPVRDTAAGFVASLARDPSLRFSESGRVLLRFIGCAAVGDEQWEEMLHGVPVHQRETVVQLARECASAWLGFADRLESRSDRGAAS